MPDGQYGALFYVFFVVVFLHFEIIPHLLF